MRKLLIVDDERIEREGIKMLLKNMHFPVEIVEAENGRKACEILEQQEIDLLLTDIRMPFMSGMELVRRTREMNKDIPIAIFSGFGEFAYAQEAIKYGVTDYILKPVKPKEFQQTIQQMLKKCSEAEARKEEKRSRNGLGDTNQNFFEEHRVRLTEELQKMEQSARSDIDRIKQYIQYHVDEDLSIDKLAAQVYLSQGYLSSVFKKETGVNLSRYIRQCRMEKAKELLKDTNMKVVQICEKVGFANVSYFCQSFREYCGVSPDKYRKGESADE